MEGKDRIIWQRKAKRRRDALIMRSLIALMILLIILFAVVLVKVGLIDGELSRLLGQKGISAEENPRMLTRGGDGDAQDEGASRRQSVLAQAAACAAQYDYDGAIQLLQAQDNYYTDAALQSAADAYSTLKENCVSYPVTQIRHVFFHTLIWDPEKAFDGDEDETGYNQYMTTVEEFLRMIEEMYNRGYVMVSLHDMCVVLEDGSVSEGEIRLPEGKTPFVLSQDDVCYYHYMEGDGFADRLVIDEDGRIKCTYREDDGSVSVGDYDLIPLIDRFVEEHPDFAYHGHKGIIALTGYEGVLGYRTDEVYKTREEDRLTRFQKEFFEQNPDFDFDAEVAEATAVAEALKADGWEFANHTWGHINPLARGLDVTKEDTERFQKSVEPIIGKTDTLIFAFGADINDWMPYTEDNEFFRYLKGQGYAIFCNVDSSQTYWVQFGNDYMRCARRNLDGYKMYHSPESLEDLFSVSDVWDDRRPVPVPDLS